MIKQLPKIDPAACTSCGICVGICPDRILTLGDSGAVTGEAVACLLCGHCYSVCPAGAITIPGLQTRLGLTSVSEADGDRVTPAGLVGLMKRRRSCRRFQEKPVALGVLRDLAQIATTAPSGTNCQGWQFVILPERGDVLRLAEATAAFYRRLNRRAANPLIRLLSRLVAGDSLSRYYRDYYHTIRRGLREWDQERVDRLFHGAPSAIVVTAAADSSCPAEDALLATGNMLLAAESMGLGTCLIGFVVEAAKRDRRIGRLLRLRPRERLYSVVACGYPAVEFLRPAGRKPLEPRLLRLGGEQHKDLVMNDATRGVPRSEKKMQVMLYSFGFKHGVPIDANQVWDVRFLPNPHWEEGLRPLSGLDPAVSDYVVASQQGRKFLELITPLLLFLVDANSRLEQRNLRLAIGCTGGRHRSVAIVERLRQAIPEEAAELTVFHRDLDRDGS